MRIKHIFLGLIFFLTSCDQSYDSQVTKVEKFFKANQIGSGNDYMLIKSSGLGQSEVGVIFGYMDDKAGCDDLAKLLSNAYPDITYHCSPLN